MDIANHYAYIATAGGRAAELHVLDISQPTSPVEVGVYDLSGSGRADSVTVRNGYAYLLLGNSGLVIDVSSPKNLIKVGEWHLSRYASKLVAVDHYLYPLDSRAPAEVLDISDPARPAAVAGNFEIFDGVQTMKVVNNRAYLAVGAAGLKIVDISNPAAPQALGLGGMPGFAEAVAVANHYAYVADAYHGLRIFDVTEPTTPTEVGSYDKLGGAWQMALKDNYAYVNFGECTSYVYPAYPDDGNTTIHILDISNPAAPVEVGAAETENHKLWKKVKIAGNYAYVLDKANLLHVFDVSNPAAPQEINIFKGSAIDFTLANGYLYLLPPNNFKFAAGMGSFTQDSYLKILDPVSLAEVGSLHLPKEYPAVNVEVAGGYAYIHWAIYWTTRYDSGWLNVDISNPAAPVLVKDVYTPPSVSAAVVDGHYTYLVADGLRVLDVSNPARPVEVDAFGADSGALDVAVADGYIYLASGPSGLDILRYPGR